VKIKDHLGDLDIDEKSNIKVDPKKMGCGVLDCIYLAQFKVHRYHNEPLCF
jgi:hypothetical protein